MLRENINCVNHPNNKFLFYCFDDKSCLCEECFRDHKSHKVEIKADIKKVSDFIQSFKKTNLNNIKNIYDKYEKSIKELKDEIEKLLSEIQKLSQKLKDGEGIKTLDEIFDIKYENYEKIFNYINIHSKVNKISLKINKINNNLTKLIPTNFKIINKEVSVINNSKIYCDYNVDILLGKSTKYQFTLFEENKEHFLIVDLNKQYYLNSIRITVTKDDCSLKNFIVYIKETNNDNENWLKINKFIRKRETENNHYESFDIGYFCKQIKFVFIDAWGINNGNYILIKKIDFEVGE